jgi:hypothetical protein
MKSKQSALRIYIRLKSSLHAGDIKRINKRDLLAETDMTEGDPARDNDLGVPMLCWMRRHCDVMTAGHFLNYLPREITRPALRLALDPKIHL